MAHCNIRTAGDAALLSLAYSCPHSSLSLSHSLAGICITPNPNPTPSCIGFFSVTVYTIPVVASSLLTIPFSPFFCFLLIPHSSFPASSVFLHLSLPSPVPHYVLPPFQLHFSLLFFILFSFPHLFVNQLFPFHYHSFPPPFISPSS